MGKIVGFKRVEFQYPLRANGLRSNETVIAAQLLKKISVPSTGQWIEKLASVSDRIRVARAFQYPLRANGLRSEHADDRTGSHDEFQYPLRANGLRSPFPPRRYRLHV